MSSAWSGARASASSAAFNTSGRRRPGSCHARRTKSFELLQSDFFLGGARRHRRRCRRGRARRGRRGGFGRRRRLRRRSLRRSGRSLRGLHCRRVIVPGACGCRRGWVCLRRLTVAPKRGHGREDRARPQSQPGTADPLPRSRGIIVRLSFLRPINVGDALNRTYCLFGPLIALLLLPCSALLFCPFVIFALAFLRSRRSCASRSFCCRSRFCRSCSCHSCSCRSVPAVPVPAVPVPAVPAPVHSCSCRSRFCRSCSRRSCSRRSCSSPFSPVLLLLVQTLAQRLCPGAQIAAAVDSGSLPSASSASRTAAA